jgi:hypothetical protein
MARYRLLPLLAAGAALVVFAASGAMVGLAAAQGTNDPFGDLDLNSLKKNGGGQIAPTPNAPVAQPHAPAEQRRISDPLLLNNSDPIGSLTRTATFDRAKRIYVGISKTGTVACYAREEGDTHRLDIGIAAQGAFVRLQTPEPREATPSPPVRIFAGKQKTRRSGGNEYATGEYTVLKAYDGDVAFYVPRPANGDFTAIGKSDPAAFLAMVAGAKTQFVVVQSIANPQAANIVAVYRFDAAMIPALLSCAKAQHFAAAAPATPTAPVAAATGPEGWTAYMNPRFGTTADYPVGIFSVRDRPPENGDGQTFRSADGYAQLSIYGMHNVESDTPQSYVDKYVDRQGVTFQRVTANFYAVSGLRDGAIFYQRCNFPAAPGDIVDCVHVSYPAGQKVAWNPIVGRLSRSLRAGQGIEPRP